jgi:EmrB/QacA subfamily drug resistance transporter
MVAVRNRWAALAALVLCVLVVGLDGTILNVALATLAADLGASTGELQWIVASYLVTFSALLLPAGLAGDRWGRKKMLLAGVALFTAASAAAAYAGDTGTLIAARAVMGAGAALIVPLSMSVLPSIFPPHERTRAISVWSVGMALGLPLGPILGGWMLENYWWGSVFLINIPAGVIAIGAAALLLPESRDPAASTLDLFSAVFSVGGLGALVYGVIDAPASGWGSARVIGLLAGGTVLIGLFIWRNLARPHPTVDLRLFRNATFTWGSVATVFASIAMMGALFVVPLYLQAVNGYSAMQTGVRLIPLIIGIVITGKLAPGLTARLGHRAVIALGLLIMAGGFFTGSFTKLSTGYQMNALWLLLAGLGAGLAMVPSMDAVLGTLPPERTGGGSGLVQTLRQVAGAFAVAGLGSVLSSVYAANLPASAPELARSSVVGAAQLGDPVLLAQARTAFVTGMDAVLLVCAAGALLGALLVWAFLPGAPVPVPEPGEEESSSWAKAG